MRKDSELRSSILFFSFLITFLLSPSSLYFHPPKLKFDFISVSSPLPLLSPPFASACRLEGLPRGDLRYVALELLIYLFYFT